MPVDDAHGAAGGGAVLAIGPGADLTGIAAVDLLLAHGLGMALMAVLAWLALLIVHSVPAALHRAFR